MAPLRISSYLSFEHDSFLTWFNELLLWVSFEKPVFGFFDMPAVKVAIWLFSMLWAFGTVWCAIWVGRSFVNEDFKMMWPVQVRASLGNLGRGADLIALQQWPLQKSCSVDPSPFSLVGTP
jgi:hypothetical protein